MKIPIILSPLLLHQIHLALAILAPDIFPTAAPACDATCLLRLIRYREQVNTDWLMALPFCSSLLQHEAYMYNYATAAADVLTQPAPPQETMTVTEIITQTSTRFTFGDDADLDVQEEEEGEGEGETEREGEGEPGERLLPRQVHLAPIHPDDERSHEDICAAYWASYKPRPKPWEFHPEYAIRAACVRLVHGDSPSSEVTSDGLGQGGNDRMDRSADADTGSAWAAIRVGFAPEEGPDVATVTVQHTVMADVVVELDTTTTRLSTWTRTRTETVTVFADERFVPVAAGVGVFNVA